jgi:hypothetical protein
MDSAHVPFPLGRRVSCRPAEASGIAGLSNTERVSRTRPPRLGRVSQAIPRNGSSGDEEAPIIPVWKALGLPRVMRCARREGDAGSSTGL